VQATEFYVIGIQKHVPRLNKCCDNGDDCVEKYLKVCVMSFFPLILLINIFVYLLHSNLYFLVDLSIFMAHKSSFLNVNDIILHFLKLILKK